VGSACWLGEVRAADLRFTVDEAAALLRQVAADLDPSAVAALAERTEGWAVGLQLAALSLRTQPDVARFVAAFTGSHRYILDYLTEEVLGRQRADVRDFLLETSVLDRLNGSLCDAVTGHDDGQELLEEVDRSGLFVVQLDDVRGWWRYHHLFADLLRARLEQEPERARRLHGNAAAWYEQHGMPDDAIRHALAAGEQEWAARLVEEHFDTVFNLRGEQATIRSWLPALSEDLVRSRPRLLLAQAQMASMRGDLQVMEPLLDAAEDVIGRADDESFAPSTGPEGSLLVNARAMLALQRSYAAQLRGDAAATAAFGSARRRVTGKGHVMPWRKPSRSLQAPPDCSTRSRLSAPGCCWLRETWRERSSGRLAAASMPKTCRITRASRASSSWPGCCLPEIARIARWCCWIAWTRPQPPSAAPEVLSRYAPSGRWRWLPSATTRPPGPL
jgi:LuxR family maltose regulon positive regulatory protein